MKMTKKITFNKLIGLTFLLLTPALKVLAGTTIIIDSGFYHIDYTRHIIIINKDVAQINETDKELKDIIVLDKPYTLTQPTLTLDTKSTYQVTAAGTTYNLYFTQLPIIHIDTKKEIVDAPSVYATFSMSELSGLTTQANLGIEIRGGSSQSYPKKSYELSFWTDTLGVSNRDVSLLGMRNDNKWNLQAMYNEPLRLNNKVSHELWLDINQLYYKDKEPDAKSGITLKYIELFVNNQYKGVYALSERVDRKQLKLKKYNNGIKGELYKGINSYDAVNFKNAPTFDNTSSTWGGFEHKEPAEMINWTNLYDFVSFVTTSKDEDFRRQYQQRFRLDNAVDYYILLNLLRATDNCGKNIYIAKYKADEPYYYVPWDLDGVFGYNWQGLQDNTTNDVLTNGFYDRLMEDCAATGFRSALIARWTALRTTVITEDYILAKFKSNNDYLLANNIYEREHLAWNQYQYDEKQLTYVASWLKSRLAYLDGKFTQACPTTNTTLSTAANKQSSSFKLYPNPTSDYLFIESETANYEVDIKDTTGKTIVNSVSNSKLHKIAISSLSKGLYMVVVKSKTAVKTEKLLIN
jgi:spore coat protein H